MKDSPSSVPQSESDDSILHIVAYASIYPALLADTILCVPEHRSKYYMSRFVMGTAIWAEAKGITRLDYVSLREVLKFSEVR